ncbi:hypothetical protein MDA_GLEAN10023651 [Myotis davidii]|uniref:Uncharacterized protein n=1 Tax=Myotis davidii TaxID=225400 RepID=L5LMN3_MYODS|nr:hypothetical protein MDA_GLEAN10023651 [Myotis davidii]
MEPATRACALDPIRTRDSSVRRSTLYPLGHTGKAKDGFLEQGQLLALRALQPDSSDGPQDSIVVRAVECAFREPLAEGDNRSVNRKQVDWHNQCHENNFQVNYCLTPWRALWQRLHAAMLQEKACTSATYLEHMEGVSAWKELEYSFVMENYRSLPEKNYCRVLPFTGELKVPAVDFASSRKDVQKDIRSN